MAKATQTIRGAQRVASLRDGIPDGIAERDICIVMAPSVRQDYVMARSIATNNPVVIVNGLAKVKNGDLYLQEDHLITNGRTNPDAGYILTPIIFSISCHFIPYITSYHIAYHITSHSDDNKSTLIY